jgi:hypothetical protein
MEIEKVSHTLIQKIAYEYETDHKISYDSLWDFLVNHLEDQKYIPDYIICKFGCNKGFISLEEAYYACFMDQLDPIIVEKTIERLKDMVNEKTFLVIMDINKRSIIVSDHITYGIFQHKWEEPTLDHENHDVCEKIKCGTPDWKFVGPYIMGGDDISL